MSHVKFGEDHHIAIAFTVASHKVAILMPHL
jgi:hypothetical protein